MMEGRSIWSGHPGMLVACVALLSAGCAGGVLDLFSTEPSSPEPKRAGRTTFEVSGGVVESARTDSGSGDGWLLTMGPRAPEDDWLFGGVAFQGELSRLRQEDDTHTTRFVFGADLRGDWWGFGGGYALCVGDGDLWGVGMQFHARTETEGRPGGRAPKAKRPGPPRAPLAPGVPVERPCRSK